MPNEPDTAPEADETTAQGAPATPVPTGGDALADATHDWKNDPSTAPERVRLDSSATLRRSADAGRYTLHGEIARGGMGVVLRARDAELGRELAVKVLLDHQLGSPEVLRRFVEEAQVGGQLQHPGVVPVYDLGMLEDDRPFFAMKLVRGRTLAELLRDRATPAEGLSRLLPIFEQVAQTIAYAHAKGVIHRDLKPSNIMVGAFGEVQVMDWGLAKVIRSRQGTGDTAGAADDAVRTARGDAAAGASAAGAILGTPAYMAPEQARGETDRIDERADVFGLGSILCEMLTGQPPFTGSNTVEILAKAAGGDTSEALARLDTCGADPELIDLAKRCVAVEPGARPADAGGVAQAIEAHLAGVRERLRGAELARAQADARADGEAQRRVLADHLAAEARLRADAEAQKRKVTLALAAAVLALVVLGGGGAAWYTQERQARVARVDALFQEAGASLDLAEARAEDAPKREEARIALAKAAEVGGRLDARRQDRLAALRDRVGKAERLRTLIATLETIRALRADHRDAARADREYAAAFRAFGLDPAASDPEAFGRSLAGGAASAELATALDDWSQVRFAMAGNQNVRGVTSLIAAARAADPDPWRDRLRTLRGRPQAEVRAGIVALARDDAVLANQPAQSLLLLGNTLGRLKGEQATFARVMRAASNRFPGDYWINAELGLGPIADEGEYLKTNREAVRYLTAAVAARPRSAAALSNLGLALAFRGDFDGAVAAQREAVRLAPGFAEAHCNLGMALARQGKNAEAAVEFRAALRLKPDLSDAHADLALGLLAQGEVDQAIQHARTGVRSAPTSSTAHDALGFALQAKGKLDEAVGEYLEAIRLNPLDPEPRNNLGLAYTVQGKPLDAIPVFRECIRLRPDFGDYHVSLGVVLGMSGDIPSAVASLREGVRLKPDLAEAHFNLGMALNFAHEPEEALARMKRARALARPGASFTAQIASEIAQAEAGVALTKRLAALLKGDDKPKDAAETVELARICRAKGLNAVAARFWANALQADPRLADDRETRPRYEAARAAAQAGVGKGQDSPTPDEPARAKLRAQARDWLRTELTALRGIASTAGKVGNAGAAAALVRWRADPDLAPIRDPDAMIGQSDEEREVSRSLWSDVDALLHTTR